MFPRPRIAKHHAGRVHDFRFNHPDRVGDCGLEHWADRRYWEAEPGAGHDAARNAFRIISNDDACDPNGPIRFIGNKQIIDFYFINIILGKYVGWNDETRAVCDIRHSYDRELADFEAGI